ncbi:hypothetical protein [Wenjunlia tyrosinilytica]|uniref:Uncharacterized protein n=1 Tax=Wenjunlia tyrosinilytica TaxID=1544741 RepID=A0A917ZUY2_9ACTN|nr:hypothetical protein [Wenjunlia tyrosinilytica]GGO95426.1 hypothetical protein GCM10012280_52590 [Wenjunlia tyrosinilytica]
MQTFIRLTFRAGTEPAVALTGAAAGTAGAGALLVLLDLAEPLRPPLILFFLLTAPGAAAAAALRRFDPLSRVVLATAAGILVNVSVAQVLLVTQLWSVRAAVVAVAAVSAALYLLPAVRALPRERSASGDRSAAVERSVCGKGPEPASIVHAGKRNAG